MDDKLLNVDQAVEALGIGKTKFYELLRVGEIRASKIGKALRVRRSELERFIESLPEYRSHLEKA